MKRLLSGNQAVARGAWEAGVRVAAGYPGTPSTEILETLAPMPGIYAEWCPNEKVATDVAVGAAYAGSRSMAVMKHVGLNVAADSFFYASMTGLEAGMVIACADDPGMHSSQGEQDSRRYAKFARVPCLEPSTSQEAKDMVGIALDLSEEFDTPVLLRITTRISHSHSIVELGPEREPSNGQAPPYRVDTTKYVMVPGNALRRHPVMEERIPRVAEYANQADYNRIEMGDTSLGIVTHGIAYQYAKEVFPHASFCRLGMTYPLPPQLIADFASQVDGLIVVEELDPAIEEEIKLMGIACEGKSIFPMVGELSPEIVRECAISAGLLAESSRPQQVHLDLPSLPPRPPVLCPGCPHRGIFITTRKLNLVVSGDIGCYTLGFLPPLGALHTCGCMGASIGQAHGVSKAGIQQKHAAVIGDSTFFHTGIPALLNIAYNQSNTITIILDNRTTAMTGHQHHPGTGYTLQGQETPSTELEPLVRALGIPNVYTVDPYNLAQVEEVLRECTGLDSPSAVISQRECVLLPAARVRNLALRVDVDKCIACSTCRRVGCPAILKSDEVYPRTGRAKTAIDPLLCTGCEICAQVCSVNAILFRSQIEAEQGVEA
ncbi:MAG: indolepyruvate ferredoxin oxidoreductase subunit alpha [Chloroflexi bacterium RBG_13_56_8]|nr:MAG: indolepyruvate ferredoxin oxidoreductase subunit alpha [Chloroflexi bacterium RBG_13_56_8]